MAYAGGGKINIGGSIIEFNPVPFTNVVMNNIEERLEACGELFEERAKANFVFQYPPASSPWDFPHERSGEMKEAISHVVFNRGDAAVMEAGIIDPNLSGRLNIYPHMLETGTSLMAPRPWLTITLDEVWNDWAQILTGMES